MSVGDTPRFEFRVWGTGLDGVAERLQAHSQPIDERDTTETYFVARHRLDVNPKVRAELLDVKQLVTIRDGFEQWTVRLKAGFPLPASLLRDELFPLLGVAPLAVLERGEYTQQHLVARLSGLRPDVEVVEVAKHRSIRAMAGCTAEITDATIAGTTTRTVALESADLTALRTARTAIGLDGYDNVSYPRAISDILNGVLSE